MATPFTKPVVNGASTASRDFSHSSPQLGTDRGRSVRAQFERYEGFILQLCDIITTNKSMAEDVDIQRRVLAIQVAIRPDRGHAPSQPAR